MKHNGGAMITLLGIREEYTSPPGLSTKDHLFEEHVEVQFHAQGRSDAHHDVSPSPDILSYKPAGVRFIAGVTMLITMARVLLHI